jgi:hypothetical protein
MGTHDQSTNTVQDTAFNGAQVLHFSVCSSTPARADVKAISPISQLSAQLRCRLLASTGGSFTSNILARSLDSHFQHFDVDVQQDQSTYIVDAPGYCSTGSVASQSPFCLSIAADYAELEVESQGGTDSAAPNLIDSVPCIESLSPPVAFASGPNQTEDLATTDESSESCDDMNSVDIASEMAATIAPRAVEPVPSLRTAFSTRHSARLETSDPVLAIQEMGWETKGCNMYHSDHTIFQEFGES